MSRSSKFNLMKPVDQMKYLKAKAQFVEREKCEADSTYCEDVRKMVMEVGQEAEVQKALEWKLLRSSMVPEFVRLAKEYLSCDLTVLDKDEMEYLISAAAVYKKELALVEECEKKYNEHDTFRDFVNELADEDGFCKRVVNKLYDELPDLHLRVEFHKRFYQTEH